MRAEISGSQIRLVDGKPGIPESINVVRGADPAV